MKTTKVRCLECGSHEKLYDCDACSAQVQYCQICANHKPCPVCGDEASLATTYPDWKRGQ